MAQEKKKTAAEVAAEGAANLGRFGKATTDTSGGGDMVKRIQDYAKSEQERKRKEEEEKKKKKETPVDTAPEKGFLQRMYDKYVGSGKK